MTKTMTKKSTSRNFARWLAAFMLTAFCSFSTMAANEYSLTATGGTLSATYSTLGAAFTAINAGTHTGAIVISITANPAATEGTTPATLNSSGAGSASYTSVLVQPAVDGVTISGNPVTGFGVIQLNGADNVTINGDNPNTGGTNRNLTVSNTTTTTVIANSAIRIATSAAVTSADNNTISNCVLLGNVTGGNSSLITSSTGSSNSSFGIYCGGNGGATATGAPTAITSVTSQTAPSGTTINGLLIDNNSINQCARGIVFNGAATSVSNGVTITNNTLGTAGALGTYPYTTPATTVYTKAIWIAGTSALTITGNTLNNILSYVATGMTGVELISPIGTGTINISNNNITAVTNNGTSNGTVGIQVSSVGGPFNVSGNTISTIQDNTSVSQFGIQISTTGGIATINGNTVSGVYARSTGGYGAAGICLTTAANGAIITNNFIYDLNAVDNNSASSTLGPIGIKLTSGTGHKVYHNSVNLTGAVLAGGSAAEPSACLMVTNTCTGLDVRNNIFQNTRTGSFTGSVNSCISLTSGLTVAANYTINNNAYYALASATNFMASTNGTSNTFSVANFNPAATTPANNWRSYTSALSAAGTNDNASKGSIAGAPFISSTNLHLNPAAGNITDVESAGANVSILTDIDGGARGATPDMGADEITLAACGSAVGGTITPSSVNRCVGQTYTMSTTGSSFGSGITYQWQVSTVSGSGYVNVTGGTGATTTSYTTDALTTGTFYYVLQVTCSGCGPCSQLSNELTVVVNTNPTVTVSPTSASICSPGGSPVTLTAGGAVSYAWNPTSGLTPTTGSPVSANPTSTTTYTVTGTDANGCTGTATSAITVSAFPAAVVITPSAPTVCSGATQMLTSTGGPGASGTSSTIGAGVAFTALTGEQTAFCNRRVNYVGQTIYTAADLLASGVVAGANITSLAYNINANGDATTNANFTVKIGHVGSTTVFPSTAFFVNTGYTTCFGPATYTHAAPGFQTITFSTPFAWDGSSNICVDVRHDGIDAINNATTQFTTTAGNSSIYGFNTPATGTLSTSRLNIRLGYLQPTTTVVWSPTTNLFTDAGASVPYTGTPSTNVVYFNGTSTTTYSVTSTNAAGCTSTGGVTVTVTPLSCSAATFTTPNCAGSNFTVTANTTGGGAPYNYTWSDGVGGVYPNAATITANLPAGTYNFTSAVTDGCGGSCSSNVTIVVNGLPTITVTPSSGTICNPGGSAVSLTATGATTYAWSPAGGLSATTGATVSANPSATTTYTVSGTDGNGCVGITTVPITVSITPTVNATATPASVCSGQNSQLNAGASVPASVTNYSFSATSGTYTPIAGGTVLASSSWDDTGAGIAIPLGFTFNFNGASYTTCNINLNGYVSFGTTTSTTNYQPINTLTANEVAIIAGFARDLQGVTTTGEVRYLSSGGVFTIQWSNTRRYNGATANAETFNFQIQLYQTTNEIKFVYGTFSNSISATTAILPQVGLRGATTAEFKNVEVLSSGNWASPSPGATNAASAYYNEANATVKPASGLTYTFAPPAPTFTYAWSPATFLSSTSISNPVAQTVTATTPYTVTVTANGCSQTANVTVTVNDAPDPVANGGDFCAGTTITLTADNNTPGQDPNTYQWSGPNSFSSTQQNPTISNANAGLHSGTYTVTVTNGSLCSATTTTTVTVNPNPTLSFSNVVDESCPGAADGSFLATAANGASPYDYSYDGFTTQNQTGIFNGLAPATYTVVAIDQNGCSVSGTQTIASPNSAPAITCGGPLNVNTDAGMCTATVTNGQLLAQVISVTGVPTPTVTFVPAAGSFPVGTTSVTATATNSCGTQSCTFNVVVTDSEIPVITCPSNIAVCDPGSPVVNFTVTATDNCNILSIVSTPASGSTFPPGTTTVNSVATDVNGNTSNCNFTVTVSTPSTAPTSATTDAANNNICLGGSVNLTANGGTLGTGASYQWYSGSCGGTPVGTGASISLTPTVTTTYFVRAEGACNNTTCASVTVTVSTAPVTSLALMPFTGMPANVCNGTVATLSIAPVNKATFYVWDVPTGSYFNGNPLNVSPYTTTTPSVTVTFGNPSGSLYNVGVQAGNACGSSVRQSQKVRGLTSVPASISGPLTACANSVVTYSTAAVTGASSYLWTVTGNATVSGTGTTATVTFGAGYTGGTLCVASQTTCYTSPAKCITISTSASTLNTISGTFTACPNSTLTYSVPASSGAASYTWTSPAGSTIISGQGTNSVSVNFGPGYSAVGSICVSVTSICGVTSAQKCKTVAPGLPSQPNSIAGPTNGLCGQSVVYSCPSQGAGVTYTWSVPAGANILSGQGTTSINVQFGTFTTGSVCVTASNTCGTSTARCITVKGSPATPGAITATPSSWCANTSGIEFNVNVSGLSGSYTLNWTYPTAPVATYAFGGGNSTQLVMDWLSGTGNINVIAYNACGSGTKTSTWSSTCRESGMATVNTLSVSPNPTTGLVNVNYTASQGNTVINVTDLAGRVVMTQATNSVEGANTTQLDMSKLAKGAYMLNVQSTQGNKQIKVVVE